METIQALLVRVHHKSERGDWKVCEMKFKELTDLFGETTFRAAGNIPESDKNEILELQGEWQTHEKYGRQFVVKEAAVELPQTLEGLERYLASSARVRGCGPALAAKIVKHFGHELWHVLEYCPSRLREMGLDDALIMRIDAAWNTDRHLRPIMILLEGHSINGRSWAKRIYNELGANSPQIITKNPYQLTKVGGIGFTKADEMAQKMGWADTSPERTEAAFMYALEEATIRVTSSSTAANSWKRSASWPAGASRRQRMPWKVGTGRCTPRPSTWISSMQLCGRSWTVKR
jgi:exodeoxyribonuclease V alpha subunit